MYKEDLALNKLQGLICHKTQPNQLDQTRYAHLHINIHLHMDMLTPTYKCIHVPTGTQEQNSLSCNMLQNSYLILTLLVWSFYLLVNQLFTNFNVSY